MSKILAEHGLLPLSSLRIIVSPLQLVSAALWEIVKQGAVMYYDVLEEFVSTVLETVPELLTDTERVQLVMGLRAKVVLELCRNYGFASPQAIQPHLSRIHTYITNQDEETASSEVKASVTNFLKLVHTLVDDQCQRDIFYEKIFPTVFGPKYDFALQALMRKFLFSLQKLLPAPNLEQTSLWLSLSPSILKECVDFMNQPEPLNTLIQHHKQHGHKVPQVVSSTGDDCILSSLSYHLPNMDNDEADTLGSETTREKEDLNADLIRNVEINGQQHDDDLTGDQGASVEVTLQPFDDTESYDDEDLDKKCFHRLKTGSRTSSKTFKGVVCGQDFCSPNKLKKHKITHSANTMIQPYSASQSSFLKKINLHRKPKTCIENITQRSEFPSLESAATHHPSNLDSLPNSEQCNNDSSLVCHVCSKVFTYPKNFDKHQRTCVAGKGQTETNPQFSTSLAHHSKPNPADETKEPSDVGSSDTLQEQKCKRSSRVKQCSVCGQIFTCSADLTRHMRCHSEQSPSLCSHCGKDFDSYEDCETHQEGKYRAAQDNNSSNPIEKNQENIVSSGITQTPSDTDAHSQAKSPLTCQECGQGFTYYKSFEKHRSKCSKRAPQRKKRADTNHFVINACNFRSSDNAKASSEKESETAKTPAASADGADGSQTKFRNVKCTMCEKNFSDIVLMKRHYSKSHKVRGSYPCPLCKRTFVRLCELVRHQQNRRLYQCAVCKKCYSKPGLLNDHEKVHSASVTPRICETCGKSFTSLAYLILHQSKHRERQPSVCSCCGKQFSTKDCLRAHMVRHTGGYPCPVCGKKFYQKTYLKWHLYKHTGQEPYLCDTCGKGWPSAAQLKLHMIQHTEERPFKCEDCGACYKRGSHLTAHRRAKHIRLRPFVCEVCSKAFRLNNELRKHMMVHTGERPYTCPRCDKTFTRKSRLREHREKACV